MKKRFLLLAIPALMVLSGCGAQTGGMSRAVNVFTDDCLVHEESFGEAGELVKFNSGIRRAAPVVNNIGIQKNVDGDKMRFVALVDNPDSIISATWTRNVVNALTGADIRPESTKSPTGYYTAINDNGTPEAAGEGKGYVVYTISNIPANAGPAMVSVYLTLENAEGTTVSNTYVLNPNDNTCTPMYTFGANETRFELMHSGGVPIGQDGEIQGDHPENNLASFTASLSDGESFNIVGHDGENNKFKVISYNNLGSDEGNNAYLFEEDDSMHMPKAKYAADYVFYLNKQYELYTDFDNIVRPMYLKDEYALWGQDSANIWIYAYGDGENNNHWYSTSYNSTIGYYVTSEMFDRTTYHTVIGVRCDPAKDPTVVGFGAKRNQTSDLGAPLRNDRKDCIKVTDWNDGSFVSR